MEVSEKFVAIAALICEPTRAKMLWSLLDGRAYTASELSAITDISASSASNHLAKLLEANIVKVEIQGRHRYYALASIEAAYAIEAMALLAKIDSQTTTSEKKSPMGIKYCRTCYDHIAGFVGVQIVESMEQKKYVEKQNNGYLVTQSGWDWFAHFNIFEQDYDRSRRPMARQCLDWSERRPHLAGQLGADLLYVMLEKKWFKKVQFSRELVVTVKGRQEIYELFGISLR